MKNVLFKFLLLMFIILTVTVGEKIICDQPLNIALKENQIKFFESPNFPMLTNKKDLNKCEINVTGNSTKSNMYLILVITKGYITNAKVDRGKIADVTNKDIYFFSPFQTLNFYFLNSTKKGKEAFQGFITYEQKSTRTCLLAAKKDPYNFKNANEIYYLRSSFEGLKETNYYEERRCLWRFVALPGYGIKLDVLGINSFSTRLHVVTDSVREYITGPAINYYNDSGIAISYDDNKHGAFEAKVSIFKLPKFIPQDNCIFDIEKLIWESDPTTSYGSNIHCWEIIKIPPNHELKVTVSNYIYNETGNLLQFYADENRYFQVKLTEIKDYIFLPYRNDTVRRLTFEFKSDENVVNKNFKMKFVLIECKCQPEEIIVPCLENIPIVHSVMSRKDGFYCANIECPFKIKTNTSCSDNHVLLEARFSDNRKRYDNFKVLSNNEELINVANVSFIVEKDKNHQALILPHRNTTMIFKSAYDLSEEYLDAVSLSLTVTSFKKPQQLPDITLTEDRSFVHNQELPLHTITTINIPSNITNISYLELTFDPKKTENKKLNCIILYRNKDLTSKIKTEETNLNLGTSVTIYNHQKCAESNVLFVVKLRYRNSDNCIMQNTTLYTNEKSLSAIAGPGGPCEVIILNNLSGNFIKNLYTNSKTDEVILYSYSNKKHGLIKFNQETANLYGEMTLNSKIYVIRIPTNKSVLIEPIEGDPYFNKPILSYYETKNYGAIFSTKTKFKITKKYKIAENLVVNFTVIDYDLSENGYLQITHDKKTQQFSQIDKIFVARGNENKDISITYMDSGVGKRGALINIEVYSTTKFTTEESTSSTSSFLSSNSVDQQKLFTSSAKSNSDTCPQIFVLFFIVFFQM